MNTTTAHPSHQSYPSHTSHSEPSATIQYQPLIYQLALLLRMLPGFGAVCGECLRRLITHARAQITLQRHWSTEAAAIDADMTKHFPLLAECLANDPPAKRKKVWLAVKAWRDRTHHLAQEVAPHCPPHLLADKSP